MSLMALSIVPFVITAVLLGYKWITGSERFAPTGRIFLVITLLLQSAHYFGQGALLWAMIGFLIAMINVPAILKKLSQKERN